MSRRSGAVALAECIALGSGRPQLDAYPSSETHLGALTIAPAFADQERRLVGPWCFLDRPLMFIEGKPMDVAPHPRFAPQTVTWFHAGEVVSRAPNQSCIQAV